MLRSNTQPAFKIIQPALKSNQTILAKLKIKEKNIQRNQVDTFISIKLAAVNDFIGTP